MNLKKEEIVSLPKINPIDSGYVARGVAVDHLGSTRILCSACGGDQKAERYRMIIGAQFGFGSPFFVKQFQKRSTTKGKLGKRGVYAQCCNCASLWAEDQGARESLERIGENPEGIVAPEVAYQVFNTEAREDETAKNFLDSDASLPSSSKVKKLPPS
jgi:hypothetical protein